ncbi:hypothetical protein GQ55_1G051400 [Panicum hallii var. hallii]|uniref:Uncharacterized protein n=1 Tax=Panicum hallii var. hallii TaxID=1504633 RepID=A0A2T7F2H9_9POAL|nr:hypothetical protein GQ55_1G051400 [Panicum hallii var. hallii]
MRVISPIRKAQTDPPARQPLGRGGGSLPATCPRAAPPHLNVPLATHPSLPLFQFTRPLLPPRPIRRFPIPPSHRASRIPRRIRASGGACGGDLPNRLATPRAGAPGMLAARAFLLFGGSAGDANAGRGMPSLLLRWSRCAACA